MIIERKIEKELVDGNMTREDLIEEFNDTLCKAKTVYEKETKELLRNTKLYDNLDIRYKDTLINGTNNIKAETNDTISAIFAQAANNKKICALNFADDVIPGGLVLDGKKTQEECLCRVSNLYYSLLLDMNKRLYYSYNEQFDGKGSNRIIYSPDVIFFKDAEYNAVSPVKCDIITCPAPMVDTATANEVINRMTCILLAAKENKVDTLILGNWGCGAFGNDKKKFILYWKKALEKVQLNEVLFAVLEDSEGISNVFGKTE